jgi:hypothetical protein
MYCSQLFFLSVLNLSLGSVLSQFLQLFIRIIFFYSFGYVLDIPGIREMSNLNLKTD